MAIKIAHFSIDERGKISGGVAGDQSGKECCVRDWYNKPWDYYIEITDEKLANAAADLFTKVANRNEAGYDQGQRLTFYDRLVECKGDVTKMKAGEADCSSGVASIYKYLGLNINHACTTRNIRAALVKTGKAKVYSDKGHTASDKYAKRGGLYLKEGSHVVMAIENGSAYTKPAVSPSAPATSSSKVIGTAVAKQVMTVRDKYNTSGKAIGYTSKNQKVEVLEVLSNGWYKIVWKNGVGYTSNANNKYYTYTAKTTTQTSAPATSVPATPSATTTTNKVVGTAVAKTSIKVRNGASTIGTKTLGYVSKGQKVEVLEVLSNGWYKIVWKNGIGYTSNASNKYYTYTAKTATQATVPSNAIKAGAKYTLSNTPIYTSSTGATVGKRSGVFYTWSADVTNGRIKMTNKPERVGVKGQVSFFVDVKNLK